MPIVRALETAPAEHALTEAVRRVHERYGKDLNSFFEHVREQQAELSSDREESDREAALIDERTAAS